MIPYSLLDLAPVCEGSDTTQAFDHMRDLARHAEFSRDFTAPGR